MQLLSIAWTVVSLAGDFSAPPDAGLERRRAQGAPFAAIIGQWTPVNDGGPAFRADATVWSGTTDRGHLQAMARLLFGTPSDTFVTNGEAAEAFPLAVFRDVSDFSSGTLKVRFKLVGGQSDQNAGIVFGLRPNGSYYFLRYNTKDGNVALWQYADGKRAVIMHGTHAPALPLNAWHELTVTVAGPKVTGVVNSGDIRVEHTFVAPVSGRVGLWTKRDAVTVFRDFRVTQ